MTSEGVPKGSRDFESNFEASGKGFGNRGRRSGGSRTGFGDSATVCRDFGKGSEESGRGSGDSEILSGLQRFRRFRTVEVPGTPNDASFDLDPGSTATGIGRDSWLAFWFSANIKDPNDN